MFTNRLTAVAASAILAMSLLAACTGGGSSYNPPPPPQSSPTPPPSPSPSPSPALNGTMQVASGTYPIFTETAASNANVVFSCGCNPQAGTAVTSGSGVLALVAMSTPTPAAPNPTYTIVPGRDYIVVATISGGQEAWDYKFAGRGSSTNQNLNAGSTSDAYSSAAALYVYFKSRGSTPTAFDNWNFNTVRSWYGILAGAAPGPNLAEIQLLNDIAHAGTTTLYPSAPTWNPTHATNSTIKADLTAVSTSGDTALPTPCPSTGCTGTPTP
jgi:hypothetical protein